jgi:hypothetical protein
MATRTIHHRRASEVPGLDRCRCEGGTDKSRATVPLNMSGQCGTSCREPRYCDLIRPSSERQQEKTAGQGADERAPVHHQIT